MSRVTSLRKKRLQHVRDRAISKRNHALKRRGHRRPVTVNEDNLTPKRRAAC